MGFFDDIHGIRQALEKLAAQGEAVIVRLDAIDANLKRLADALLGVPTGIVVVPDPPTDR